MSENDDVVAVEMACGVFYAAELVPVEDVARDPYNEEVSNISAEDLLRHHSGISAADHYRVRMLPVFSRILQPRCVNDLNIFSVSFLKPYADIVSHLFRPFLFQSLFPCFSSALAFLQPFTSSILVSNILPRWIFYLNASRRIQSHLLAFIPPKQSLQINLLTQAV
jgi:hypothetical protein